jgi:hypothetical protein
VKLTVHAVGVAVGRPGGVTVGIGGVTVALGGVTVALGGVIDGIGRVIVGNGTVMLGKGEVGVLATVGVAVLVGGDVGLGVTAVVLHGLIEML